MPLGRAHCLFFPSEHESLVCSVTRSQLGYNMGPWQGHPVPGKRLPFRAMALLLLGAAAFLRDPGSSLSIWSGPVATGLLCSSIAIRGAESWGHQVHPGAQPCTALYPTNGDPGHPAHSPAFFWATNLRVCRLLWARFFPIPGSSAKVTLLWPKALSHDVLLVHLTLTLPPLPRSREHLLPPFNVPRLLCRSSVACWAFFLTSTCGYTLMFHKVQDRERTWLGANKGAKSAGVPWVVIFLQSLAALF